MPRVTISEPGKTPQPYRFKLERKVVKIGRSGESDIIIECASVSTNHCTMERVDGGYILRDNHSTNGIKQESTLMEVIDLYDGMEVLIGDVPMKFQLAEAEIDSLSEEEFSTHQKKKLPPSKDDGTSQQSAQKKAPDTTIEAQAKPAQRIPPRVQKTSTQVSFFIVFVLMIAGIIIGMTLRHYRETGDFLISKWVHGTEEKTPETQPGSQEEKQEDDIPPSEPNE